MGVAFIDMSAVAPRLVTACRAKAEAIRAGNQTSGRNVQTDMRKTLVVAALTAVVATACGGTGAAEWGPLALVEATGEEARTEGVVVITDVCVFLERDGERELLVWPADRTRWNAGDGTIAFTTGAGNDVTLESGQYVVLGGGGAHLSEDGDAWVDNMEWARRSAPECLTDGAWFVTDIQ